LVLLYPGGTPAISHTTSSGPERRRNHRHSCFSALAWWHWWVDALGESEADSTKPFPRSNTSPRARKLVRCGGPLVARPCDAIDGQLALRTPASRSRASDERRDLVTSRSSAGSGTRSPRSSASLAVDRATDHARPANTRETEHDYPDGEDRVQTRPRVEPERADGYPSAKARGCKRNGGVSAPTIMPLSSRRWQL